MSNDKIISKAEFANLVETRVLSNPDNSYISVVNELIEELDIDLNSATLNKYLNDVILQKIKAEAEKYSLLKEKIKTNNLLDL